MDNAQLIESFEEFLFGHLQTKESFHPNFQKAYFQMFQAGGKRFRPLLLLSIVDTYQQNLLPNAMHVALAVEMLHTYSLIHDDLPSFDNAPLRRGVETLHVSYDEVTATLVGDALNSDAFWILSRAPLSPEIKVTLIETLSYNGGSHGMVLGQAIDCFFEEQKLSLEHLKFLHQHKTAMLIAASMKMGAIIADLPREERERFYQFGLKLGLLFQIQDDLIDATETSQKAGKPTGNDREKNSFTNLLGVEGAIEAKEQLKEELFDEAIDFKRPLDRKMRDMIEKYFK